MPAHAPRVMQSFKHPRPTTNPYIVQLDRSLASTPAVEHTRFSWRDALLTRVDVLHLHWPEVLIEGDRAWKRWGKRTLLRILLMKLSLTNAAVVRTVHNVDFPDVQPVERRLLERIEKRTDHRILLNTTTRVPSSSPSSLIPHGHYIDWYAAVPQVEAAPGTLGFVGLVRRYKGVEHLIAVFAETRDKLPESRLRISGNPTSPQIADEVRALAAADGRIELDLRFLSDVDFATAVMSVRGLVLPYRSMHNSGTVLAALSVERPVLVPRNEVNTLLAEEVGPGWIHFFDEALTRDDIVHFQAVLDEAPSAPPRLHNRGWSRAGELHGEVYLQALSARRRRTSGSRRGDHEH